jgi:hypothetical protein
MADFAQQEERQYACVGVGIFAYYCAGLTSTLNFTSFL